MPLHLLFIFFSGLSFLLLNCNVLFFDEEFLVGLCLVALYAFAFLATRRLLRFIFFHKVDFVYFSFYFLLKLLVFFYDRIRALLQFFLLQGSFFYSLQLTFFFTFCLLRSLEQLREGLCLDFLLPAFLLHYYLTFTLFFMSLLRNVSFSSSENLADFDCIDDLLSPAHDFFALPLGGTEEEDFSDADAQLAHVFAPRPF